IYNMFNFVSNNLFEELISDINSRSDELIEQISLTLKDSQFDWITDNDISISIKIFVESIRRVVERYNKELDWQERKLDMINKRLKERNISQSDKRDLRNRRIEVETQIEKLKEKTSLISYFMDMNILPRYAFPGIFVAISDVRGFEDFSGRARNYAITEYAPNMEVYLKKAIYKSMGVDFEFFQPTSKSFFICPKCEKFATEYVTDLQNGCPICGSRSSEIKSVDAIEPNRIYIRKTNRPIYEPIEFQEALSNVYFFSRNITQNHIPFVEPNIQIVDYGNIELLQVVSGISINGDSFPIELCDRCGKVKEPDEFIKPKPHYKLASEGKCNGRYRKLSLYHRMPTNVISLKLKGSLFGVNIENIFEKMKKIKPSLTMENFQLILLTTLKNALINGAQRLLQTEDGEIDGEVKDSEIILFDNVDGGVGYVSEIARRFEDVLKEAAEMVLDPDDDCESGCLECLWSYRRKRDIEFIDKRCIKEIFEAFRKKILSEKISLEGEIKKSPEYRGKNIRTVHSPPYSFAGINELKNLVRGAREEIILTSLYVTDDKIPWEDETEKSWVDILVDIKSSSPPLKITVIVNDPTSEKHKEALKRLSDRGINVKIFRKEIEKMLPSIVHSKLIVIDPHIPSTRYAVHTSANFSPEMWKNHETFDFGNDEEWVKGTYKEIRNIIEQSLDFKG
ncbi:MAG: Zn-binding domain-containing protein, partial [Candidatus Nanoarchaeia archaeon]|nr:DUF1998 domain-containing protein [Candidatus Jingweiarchaeum tengchongense]